MQLMLEKAKDAVIAVTKESLAKHGSSVELFPGLADGSWFDRTNKFAEEHDLNLDHYILSSGTLEMINGCPISRYFKKIFASKYMYVDETAIWPCVAINYTTKTQYLFRLNKGIENTWNDDDLNKFTPENKRPLPFENMVFFGDGDTDVPTMKMLKHKGGTSVAVYEQKEKKGLDKIHKLLSNERVDFTAPADYKEHSQLDITAKGILGRIARHNGYDSST
ncbi:hypothetical protein ACFFUT_06245 [Pseudohalocynthiibacter aestuariivivens]|uniref:Haloacid dehalogenase-like hydrolase n=1 Tax=Pseudohalocynthiibacter aestuariivivens TaxID=1591409 RepID=A0ABV5JD45_9RHOB|nr:haloacid dehalogenase-like hydrolase [Pseudohalocynthiibacter aestuariivivens]MBS9717124.1 haloacid dehalogenase-like hydrolase [Pseudohalocynthiibacter aestuariivivens]